MDIDLQRASGITLALGALFFLVAAFLPVSMRVFPEPSPERRLEHIAAARTQWSVGQVLFGLGAIVTVAGVVLLSQDVRVGTATRLLQICAAVLLIGAVVRVRHVYQRGVDPAAFTAGALPAWPVLTYFVLTEVALGVYGVALLHIGLAAWVGWLVIVSMTLLFVLTIAFRDMVPAAYYLVTLITAVMLW